jgi:hypothetical protein
VAKNPSGGAIIDYRLAREPKSEVKLEILDAAGKTLRTFSSVSSKKGEEQAPEWPDLVPTPDKLPTASGANRFVWDMRTDPPTKIPGAFYSGLAPEGPIVPPGRYQVRLTAFDKVLTAPLELRLDPRVAGSEAAVAKEFELAMQVRDELERLHVAVNQIRAVRADLDQIKRRIGDQPTPSEKEVLEACTTIDKKMSLVEGELVQVKRKSSEGNLRYPSMLDDQLDFFRQVIEADVAPTRAQVDAHDALARRLGAQLAKWKDIVDKDVPAFNQQVQRAEVPGVRVR